MAKYLFIYRLPFIFLKLKLSFGLKYGKELYKQANFNFGLRATKGTLLTGKLNLEENMMIVVII